MRPVFPSWVDEALRLSLAAMVLCVLGVPIVAMAWVRSPLATGVGRSPEQPIQFDHRHHVRDAGIDCMYCHYDARRSSSAGVPELAICMGCHRQVRSDAPQLKPLVDAWNERAPVAWRRVVDLPDFVFFDHAIHVTTGVGCETCHGRVDDMASVRQEASFSMGWCLDCHRDPRPHLRPAHAVTEMGYDPSKETAWVRPSVHPPQHCSGCHR